MKNSGLIAFFLPRGSTRRRMSGAVYRSLLLPLKALINHKPLADLFRSSLAPEPAPPDFQYWPYRYALPGAACIFGLGIFLLMGLRRRLVQGNRGEQL